MIIQKPLASVTESDLTAFVTNRVSESDTLDYKLGMYAATDSDRKEMLRDVSSMANAQGGHILIGVREENEVAVEIAGFDQADLAVERLLSSCLTGIHERINGLDARVIPLSNGRALVAVYIPPSTRMPHMVTFQSENRFWIRHGRQKMRMSVEEVRAACHRVENLAKTVESFLATQRDRVVSREARIQTPNRALLRVAVTPLAIGVDRFDIGREDIRNLMKRPPGMRDGGWVISWDCPVQPTMHGLKTDLANSKSLEVFRNGHAELQIVILPDGHFTNQRLPDGSNSNVLYPLAIVEYTVSSII